MAINLADQRQTLVQLALFPAGARLSERQRLHPPPLFKSADNDAVFSPTQDNRVLPQPEVPGMAGAKVVTRACQC